jgi:alpha-tubulin suppressor-like RCC1 family protein
MYARARWAGVLAALAVAAAIIAVPAAAQAAVQLSPVAATKKPATLVTFSGRAGGGAGAQVTIQRNVGGSWRRIAGGRTGKNGKFALTWITPSRATSVVVRATGAGGSSATRHFRVLAPAKGAHLVTVSPKTQIISPSTVQSAPAGGASGKVVYGGGNQTAPGQILVIGAGSGTPNGFIGKVTSVQQQNGQTVATTVPATLLQAVPDGSMNIGTPSVTASRLAHVAKATISCTGSAGFSITHDITFSAGLDLNADWSFLHGLQSASVTANAGLTASIQAAVAAAGSCSLDKRAILTVKGPSVDTFVGPVPIVMTSKLTVYIDASATAQASVSTSASAGFSASAGVGWKKGSGFYGISSFTPSFNFSPPTLSASADVNANITPTVDVLLYGVAGPEVALQAGLDFNADIAQNPWWSLTAPVNLTASITIPALNLSSPSLTVYSNTFPILAACGAFGCTGAPTRTVHNVATPATSLAVGHDQACVLHAAGTVSCWGGNMNGDLGGGLNGARNVPTLIGASNVAGLAAGDDHTCELQVNGGVNCWGDGGSGQTAGASSAIAIAAGAKHTCAVIIGGTVQCWGANDSGQLAGSGMTGATAVASNSNLTCAIAGGGSVWCWGSNNSDGSLGNGSTNPSSTPVQVKGLSNAVSIAAGSDHACAVVSGGTVWCWGAVGTESAYGQLGNGGSSGSTVPVQVSGITNATQISAGLAHTCARLSTGQVRCWGWDNYGQLGNGASNTHSDVPVTVSGISNAAAVSAGDETTCELNTSGGVACWGWGGDGEMGNGTSPQIQTTPVNVSGLP